MAWYGMMLGLNTSFINASLLNARFPRTILRYLLLALVVRRRSAQQQGTYEIQEEDDDVEEYDDDDADADDSSDADDSAKVDDVVKRIRHATKQGTNKDHAKLFSELEEQLEHQQDRATVYVSEKEKAGLQDELKDIMMRRFVDGKDIEFDYRAVDQNPDYDVNPMRAHDDEDAYFDDDDD